MLCETFWDNLGLFLCREKVMKPNQPTHPLPDFDADLEDDVVWNLIDDASPADPPPRFVGGNPTPGPCCGIQTKKNLV